MKYVNVVCHFCRYKIKSNLPCNTVTELIGILFRPKAFKFSKHVREVIDEGYVVCQRCKKQYNRYHLPEFYIIHKNNEIYTPPYKRI